MQTVHHVPADHPIWTARHGIAETTCATPEDPRTASLDPTSASPAITRHPEKVTCLDCIMTLAAGSMQRGWTQRAALQPAHAGLRR